MTKLSIKDLQLKGQRVLIRVDFNVPIKDGKVDDDTRIRAAIPTIKYATDHGARVILASHLGRPKGEHVEKYSLRPVAEHLASLIGKPVEYAEDCIGDLTARRRHVGRQCEEGAVRQRVAIDEEVRAHDFQLTSFGPRRRQPGRNEPSRIRSATSRMRVRSLIAVR